MRFLFFLFIFFYSCANDPSLVKDFVPIEQLPIEEIEEAEILHTEGGILKVKVVSSDIKRFKEGQPALIFSNGIKVIFYNDSGFISSTLEAQSAEIDEIRNIMKAYNNVSLTSIEGEKIESEELIWDEKRNKIYTDKEVLISTQKEMIQGEGFESNPDFSEYSISKIHGTFRFNTSNQ